MIALSLAMAVAALLLFGLATDHHHLAWRHHRPERHIARRLRGAGWCLVAAASVVAVIAWGPRIAPVGWIGLVMAGAAASFLFLNLAPKPAGRRDGTAKH